MKNYAYNNDSISREQNRSVSLDRTHSIALITHFCGRAVKTDFEDDLIQHSWIRVKALLVVCLIVSPHQERGFGWHTRRIDVVSNDEASFLEHNVKLRE